MGKSKKFAGPILSVSHRDSSTVSKIWILYTQLSFIQLGGGIAVGVHAKGDSNLLLSKLQVSQAISLGVRTTASLSPTIWWHHLVGMVFWERALRYYDCHMHDLLCGFLKFLPLWICKAIKSQILFTMAAFAIRYHYQTDQDNFKENYSPDDRDRVLDRYINSIPIFDLCLTMTIPAVIGILCFSLVILQTDSDFYYQFPVGIIGKVYANSMVVLINSRMILGSEESEETPSIISSGFKFATVPANNEHSVIHDAHSGDVALDIEVPAGHLRGLYPERF